MLTTPLRQDQDGTAAVEFALVAPFLFFLIFGILELSIYMYSSSVIENATTTGARLALTGNAYTGNTRADVNSGNLGRNQFIVQRIEELSMGLIDVSKVQIHVELYDQFGQAMKAPSGPLPDCNAANNAESTCDFGGALKTEVITVTYPYSFTPFLGGLFGDAAVNIRSMAVAQNENF